ncbi:MAG: sensor domain-containing diguanylate cyclase [Anaerolineae bacterium]|nr:MAG: sensor domain-containing diguanylate cyclase [Anaerolineae bacterium]
MKPDSSGSRKPGKRSPRLATAKAQKLFFEALVMNIPVAVVTLDEKDRIISCNPAFEELFGYLLADIEGSLLDELITTEHTLEEAMLNTRSAQRGKRVQKIGVRKRADGSEVEVDILAVPVMLAGEQIGALAMYTNLTEQRKIEEQLKESRDKLQVLASIDPLTGIWNRRAIADNIRIEAMRAAREQQGFALVLIDLDNLKSINDAYGHLAGDKALQKLADAIQAVSRVYDRVGRWGGDEFMLVLFNVNETTAYGVVDRVLQAVRKATMQTEQGSFNLSVSIGVAFVSPRGTSPIDLDEVFSLADKALYEAKAAGRDTLVFKTLPVNPGGAAQAGK